MELRPDLPKRLEALGGEHDDRKAGKEVEVAPDHAQADLDGDERSRYRREKLQDGPRKKGDVERLHRGAGVGVAKVLHALARRRFAAERLEGGQAGEKVEELGAQALHGSQALI